MSLMWMPALMIRAPLALARSAAGIRAPTGAKTIAPSSSSGAGPSEEPRPLGAQLAGEGLRLARRPRG